MQPQSSLLRASCGVTARSAAVHCDSFLLTQIGRLPSVCCLAGYFTEVSKKLSSRLQKMKLPKGEDTYIENLKDTRQPDGADIEREKTFFFNKNHLPFVPCIGYFGTRVWGQGILFSLPRLKSDMKKKPWLKWPSIKKTRPVNRIRLAKKAHWGGWKARHSFRRNKAISIIYLDLKKRFAYSVSSTESNFFFLGGVRGKVAKYKMAFLH